MRVLVIGAGFAGACAALLLRESLGAEVLLVERGAAPGGMLRTLHTREGVPYEYGPRVVSVFRGTPDILPFLRRFLALEERVVYQGTRLRPDFPVIPFPVDLESVRRLPCGATIERELAAIREQGAPPGERDLRDYLETSVGPTLTGLAFEGFNRKFWGRPLQAMPAVWGKLRRLERIASTGSYRLPSEAAHYYPPGGFNPLFERMLDGFELRCGVTVTRIEADAGGATVETDAGALRADLVVSTAPIDAMLGFRHGPLEWRGYRVEVDLADPAREAPLGTAPDGVPFAWLYTPWAETPVCRTTDFGVIHHGPRMADRPGPTVVLREIVDDRVSMYPVWWEDERFLRYLDDAARVPNVIPLGRLGLYKYTTMDSTYAMALRLAGSLGDYLRGSHARRVEILRAIRGDWGN
ncbi:MAG: NAD(P)-binding protein [Burkholderiales bacterium]|jgi:UDP-galactopyranose mutase|nr:NAD(P)-binding protein [Burkholderiales bacterium]